MSTVSEAGLIREIARFLKSRRAASVEEISAVVDGGESSIGDALATLKREGLIEVRKSNLDQDRVVICTDRLLRSPT